MWEYIHSVDIIICLQETYVYGTYKKAIIYLYIYVTYLVALFGFEPWDMQNGYKKVEVFLLHTFLYVIYMIPVN